MTHIEPDKPDKMCLQTGGSYQVDGSTGEFRGLGWFHTGGLGFREKFPSESALDQIFEINGYDLFESPQINSVDSKGTTQIKLFVFLHSLQSLGFCKTQPT